MLPKCLLLLWVTSFIDASGYDLQRCAYPRLEHGRIRIKQKGRLVKFLCAPRYELAGDRYATCINGHWDSPVPVCVRGGCELFPVGNNSVQVREHQSAWVVTFCLPGYRLEGSSTVYCDGHKWNASAPQCVETTSKSSLSCDFEDRAICGWTHDELHDFDWRRWNEKTPSAFILTGPSYDHTYGVDKLGYYMYIESSSKAINATARLLSPVYDLSLSTNGCFQFFYHMYGNDMGGLRVYQKPVSLQLLDMLSLQGDEQKYLLFKIWGNQGNQWYSDVPQLIPMTEDFQIVIEGIRGSSFISDIAIDDVSILQGGACAAARRAAVTPAPPTAPDYVTSCVGRCEQPSRSTACGCSIHCLMYQDCCPDFIDVCFNTEETDSFSTSTETLPETQKLVGETTTIKPTTAKPSTTTTTSKPTTPKPTTPKPTTTKPTTTKPTTTKPTTTKPTTTKPTTTRPTTTKPTTTKRVTTQATTLKLTSSKSTSPMSTSPKSTSPKSTSPKSTSPKSTSPKALPTTAAPRNNTEDTIESRKAQAEINLNKIANGEPQIQSKSSTWKTAVVTIILLALSLSLVYVAVSARTARGRQAIARLRGRTSHDSEVRYLNSAGDDDL